MFQINTMNSVQHNQKSRRKWRFLSICFIVTMIGVFCISCGKSSPDKSPIDDVSDEVYEQMVQQYFFLKKSLEVVFGEAGEEYTKGSSWITEHELYEEAEEYAEEHEVYPLSVFPNPLLAEYVENPEQFSETEQTYIEKILEFYKVTSRAELEDFERLKTELKEELEIKDSYDMFEETK